MNADLIGRRWTFSPAARVVRSLLQRLILFPLLALVTPVTVRDRARLRSLCGPVIVAANHVSHLDTPVILKALPAAVRRRLIVVAAKDYFYRGRIRGALVSLSLATIPFDRDQGSAESLAQCQDLLERGWSLLVFPEGTRSASGELGRVRRGVAVMATATGTPVLPLYVHGLAEIMPKGSIAPLPGGVVVEAGNLLLPGADIETTRNRLEDSLHDLASRAPEWGRAGRNSRDRS
ncbi:MAG: 1-acyl-sn-glycerol-3-phosphate acyltransferase [Acidobacteria bacterium]|nr:1-acyl-sn-glycerol-3-phosphate acyltransferase [Acidobacteriota bacterium]